MNPIHLILPAVFAMIGMQLSAAIPDGTFPWYTLQAEDGTTNAKVIGPSRKAGTFASECVGRRGVKLNRTEDYVEFTVPAQTNAIVIRYAIPDAPGGGGIECTLSLYVDGKHRRDLSLTSRHAWLYGRESEPVNDPAALKFPGGTSFHFFDETRALVGEIPAGAKIRLQKDSEDTALFYIIDLIELEQVPPRFLSPQDHSQFTTSVQ